MELVLFDMKENKSIENVSEINYYSLPKNRWDHLNSFVHIYECLLLKQEQQKQKLNFSDKAAENCIILNIACKGKPHIDRYWYIGRYMHVYSIYNVHCKLMFSIAWTFIIASSSHLRKWYNRRRIEPNW